MNKIILYLLENHDVLEMVKEGTACLIGIDQDHVNAILEILFHSNLEPNTYFWF